jgi:hypothetical protein
MRIYKLYATASSTTQALAQLIIQRAGKISGILFSHQANSGNDDFGYNVELSFASVGQQTTNDTVGPIAESRFYQNLVTTGLTIAVQNHYVGPALGVDVVAGDRLYLNLLVTGTGAFTGSIFIFVDER